MISSWLPLILFIVLGVVVAMLIEINERIKAKRPKENCPQENVGSEDCSACELISVCEKKSSNSTGEQ